jgi:hypothetical protein
MRITNNNPTAAKMGNLPSSFARNEATSIPGLKGTKTAEKEKRVQASR